MHSSNINNQIGGKASRFSNANKHESNNRKHKQDVKSRGNITSKPNPKGKWCTFHKTDSHDSAECFVFKKQRQDENKRVEVKPKQPTKKYPRIYESSDSEDEIKLIGLLEKESANKIAPLRIKVQILHDNHASDALCDSGSSKSITNATTMSAKIKHGSKLAPSSTMFKTVGGDVTSSGSTVVQVRFPKLNPTSTITDRFEVINDSQEEMFIGLDLMDSLGIVLNFKDKVVQEDGHQTYLNTGGSGTALIRADTSDREFPDGYKEVVDDGVHPTDLVPNYLPAPLAARILKLLEEHHLLYDGRLGRMRFDDYVLPMSKDFRAVHASPYALALLDGRQGQRRDPAPAQRGGV